MKAMRLIACLFIIGLIFGCSGSGGGPGGEGVRQGQNVVLPSDQLISHVAGQPTTPLPSDQSQPAVAYDTSLNTPNQGRYLIAWTDSQKVTANCGGVPCGTDILGSICTGSITGGATSLSCGGPFPISTAAGNQAQPKVAFFKDTVTPANSKYLVVWTDSRNGYSQIYGQFLTTTGTLIGSEFTISQHGPQIAPDVTPPACVSGMATGGTATTLTDATQAWLVNQWAGGTVTITGGTGATIPRRTYPITTNTGNTLTVSAWVTIPNDTSTYTLCGPNITYTSTNQSDPDLIYDTVKNRFVVTWLDINSYDNNQIFTWCGINCTNCQPYTYIAIPNSDNNMIQSVEVDPATGIDASSRKQASEFVFRGTGGFVESGGTLTASFGVQKNESKPKITFSAVTGDYFDSWSGMDHSVIFRATYTVDTGCVPATPCTCTYKNATYTDTDNDVTPRVKIRKDTGLGLVQDFSFGTIATSPALATDPNTNRVLVSWEENNTGTGTGIDILGQLVDLSNFVNFGSQINISKATGDQTAPAASFDNANQRFFVVFEDARNQSANISNIDIYGQFIDPQGNLSGGNAPVTTASGNQIAPALAFGDVNFTDFLVVWKDGRNPGDADIRGQLLQFSTAPQLLIEDGNGNPILNSSIDFGNVAVGATQDVPFKICNFGNTQLTILPLNGVQTPTIPDLPYSFTVPSPVTISPGTCYPMNIRFAPTAAGSYAGNPTNNFKTTINSDGGLVTLFFSGNGVGNQPLAVTTASLPDASIGISYTATLTAFGGVFPYSWSIVPGFGALPAGLTLNANTGVISGTPTAAGTSTFTVQVTDNGTPVKNTATRVLSINVSLIKIINAGLKPWTQGIEYSSGTLQTMTATGGTSPYTWSISGGSLPPGILLNSTTGALTGVPTSSGVFSFTVKVTDSSSPTNQSTTKNFSITINPPPAILTSSLPSGVVSSVYTQPINSSGGTSPFNWTITTGSLPPGLSIDSGTGVISGTLTQSQPTPYTFTVKVSDSTGASTSASLNIQVNSLINITTTALTAGATVGIPYTTTFAAAGGTLPYTWGIVAGAPPDGLTFAVNTGMLSGTPTAAGTFSFAVQVTDRNSLTASKVFSLTVAAAPPPPGALSITTTGLKPWTAGIGGYTEQFAAAGGQPPYSWSTNYGTGGLPAGLTLSSSGLLSGTPTTAIQGQVLVKVTDAKGTTVTGAFNLAINPALAIATTALVSGTPGLIYNQQVVLSGGTAPYSWSISNGTLPNGLSLDPIVGTITGTPTTAGTYNFTVKVADGPGAMANAVLTIQISSGLSMVTTSLGDTFIYNNSYSQTLFASGGRPPYSWSILSGALPTGVTLDKNTGIISGTPTTLGTFTFVVQLTDADGRTATNTFSIKISNSTDLLITTTSLPDTFDKTAYSQTLTASGGVPPYSWDIAAGALPDGLSLNSSTGMITGTPTTSGTFGFTVRVKDPQGRQSSKTFSIAVVSSANVNVVDPNGNGTAPKEKIKFLKSSDLPPLPNSFVMIKALQFEIDNVIPNSTVRTTITFTSFPASPVFYKVTGDNTLINISNCSSSGDTNCIESVDTTNRKVTVRILDNGIFDKNPTAGIIVDPIVLGYMSSVPSPEPISNSSGGGCSVGRRQDGTTNVADAFVMLAPLFAIIALRNFRRKKK